MYDPDFYQVGRWDTYGLTASLLGVQHTIFIPISLSALFEKDGTYWVVLFFKDKHADQHKNHQLKTTILGYSGICETYYSGEVDGQVTYFKHLWPEELEEDLLALAEAIPPDAKECPICEGDRGNMVRYPIPALCSLCLCTTTMTTSFLPSHWINDLVSQCINLILDAFGNFILSLSVVFGGFKESLSSCQVLAV